MSEDALSPAEQRRASRQNFITFVWYKRVTPPGAPDTGDEGIARSCDISNGGIGLVTARPLAQGVQVFVELVSKGGGLSFIAIVAHCRQQSDGSFRVGLRVQIVPPNDRPTLERILAL